MDPWRRAIGYDLGISWPYLCLAASPDVPTTMAPIDAQECPSARAGRCATKSTEVSCRPSIGSAVPFSSARRSSPFFSTGQPDPTKLSDVSEEDPEITYEK